MSETTDNYRFYACRDDEYERKLKCYSVEDIDTYGHFTENKKGYRLYAIRKIYPEILDRFLLAWDFKTYKLGYSTTVNKY